MSTISKDIYGFKVYGEDDAKEGLDYLDSDIQAEEARVFFDQAKAKNSVHFEDEKGHNFTLLYKKDNTYWVYKREADSSTWF